jgi:hypothetical protein
MVGRKRRDIPAPLARGRDRFVVWRRTRKAGTRIPDKLWTLAVKLADGHGLHRTASVLRLDYYALKKRLEARNSDATSVPPAFVELASPSPSASSECVVEWEDGAGASLRVHLRGGDVPDLVALGRSFWRSGSDE